ncbi:MAG: MTH938/NDUFAF3 family protein [Wenzhouxiangellaceae bacterium]|nr:MTH938/NDUFAF3 family protein [Wenzhouxiangellaceae bacterium]
MQLTRHLHDGQYYIHSLGDEAIRIVDRDYAHSLLLSPEHGVREWPVGSVAAIAEPEIEPIFELDPDVVLLASGRTMQFPAHAIRYAFAERAIGLEVMPLDAAARTFNILAGEGRAVVAALIWEPATRT